MRHQTCGASLLAELRADEEARIEAKQSEVARQHQVAAADRREALRSNGPAPTAADTDLLVSQWRARWWQ